MVKKIFFQEYSRNSFIAFCLILYFALFALSPVLHLNTENQFYGNQLDLRLIVMFLLAEPHFAMTIPLLYGYRNNFTERPLSYALVPFLIVFFGTILFFKLNNLFVLLFLLANVYHVNRQSVGFFMLQGRLPFEMKFLYEASLHILTFVCLYIALIFQHHSITSGLVILMLFTTLMLTLFKIKTGSLPTIKGISVILQGYFIFIPIVIFSDLLLAFAVGISIHYLQYLSISWRVCKFGFLFSMKIVLFLLIFYSILSTAALSGYLTLERISIVILIPTIMQLLHFYYDSLIWRRKDGGEIVSITLSKSL
jgi:hypothetical protein